METSDDSSESGASIYLDDIGIPFVRSKSRILIADDEPFNISALLGIMKVLGLADAEDIVDTCYDGSALVSYVSKAVDENDHERYSLILTDC